MNTAARALAEGILYPSQVWNFACSLHNLVTGILLAMVLLSAFSVVYVKDLNRRSVSRVQSLNETRDQLHMEWGQLLLEQNTWSAAPRVQPIAQQALGMSLPHSQMVVMVKL